MTRASSTSVTGWLRIAILGAAVLWGAGSFGFEVFHAFADSPPPLEAPPSQWTLRAAPARELSDFLKGLDAGLPRGSLVAVGDRGLPASEDFFLSLWVAYDLPHHDVVRARHRPLLDRADYLFLYRSSLEDFREEAIDAVFAKRPVRVAEHPAGTLYRIPRK
jgi:hypothetical protein